MAEFSEDPYAFLSSDDVAGQRNDARDSLLLVAHVRIDGRPPIQVRVRNLSAGGLMAEYAATLAVGTPIEVEVRGIGWVAGKVAWVAEGRAGVAFDTPIDPLLARKPVGGGPRTGQFFQKPVVRAPRG